MAGAALLSEKVQDYFSQTCRAEEDSNSMPPPLLFS